MSAVVAGAPGWFGKLPSLGDFASRRLPPSFVAGWDGWLQRELPRSRRDLGAAWLDAYLVAPVRRYWLAPGLLGETAWLGIWMPSVDAVGRHFPLTVAAAWSGGPEDALRLPAVASWFDAVDAAARAALDPQRHIDAFERTLAGAAAPLVDALSGDCRAHVASPRHSWWWCPGVDDTARTLRAAGLPAGADFDALLAPCV